MLRSGLSGRRGVRPQPRKPAGTRTYDGCTKERYDVQATGQDANGTPDGPGLCFVCRKEARRQFVS